MRLYLASSSPRRQELLRQLDIAFEVIAPQIAELPQVGEAPRAYVARLAREKAEAGAAIVARRGLRPLPILGADTEVVVDGEILGKPLDRAHAFSMLHRLSGRSHEVLTALCVIHEHVPYRALSESRVTFGPLTDAEIGRYWETGEPRDKAGAYAIQGRGAGFVAAIAGSYSGVVGLPLYELAQILKKIDWNGCE